MQIEKDVTGKMNGGAGCSPGELPCGGKHALVLAGGEKKQVLLCVFMHGRASKHMGPYYRNVKKELL